MNQTGLIAYSDWLPVLEDMDDADAGELMKALMRLAFNGEVYNGENVRIKSLYRLMGAAVMRDKERYAQKCARNQQNGRKGGRPRLSAPADNVGIPFDERSE